MNLFDLDPILCKSIPPLRGGGSCYYSPRFIGLGFGTVNTGVLYAMPFCIPNHLTVAKLAVGSTFAYADAVVRLGIYDDNDGTPYRLVLDSGTVGLGAAGVNTVEAAVAQKLCPGQYWLAAVVQGAVPQGNLLRADGNNAIAALLSTPLPVVGGPVQSGSIAIRPQGYSQPGITDVLPPVWGPIFNPEPSPVVVWLVPR